MLARYLPWLQSHCQAGSGFEALEPRQPHLCVSVSFLVQDDASAKVLAPNLGASNGGGGWDQASGVITIPAASVKRTLAVSPLADTLASGSVT